MKKQKGSALLEILTIMSGLMLLSAVMMVPVYYLNVWECSSRWAESGIQSKYESAAGCRIQVDGKWIPEDRYRAIDE